MNVVSPAPRELWSQVVKASPEALAFHTPQWLDCICATGVYEDASLAYEMVGDRKFILPLVRRTWLPPPLTTEASLPLAGAARDRFPRRWSGGKSSGPSSSILPGEKLFG